MRPLEEMRPRTLSLPLIFCSLLILPSCFWLPTSKGTDLSSDVSADSSAECPDSQSSWNSSLVLTDGSSIATSREIKLTLSARNDKKISHYHLSEDSTEPSSDAAGWVGIEETTELNLSAINFQLSENDGEKTIHGWFKDSCGEISPVASLKITFSIDQGGIIQIGYSATSFMGIATSSGNSWVTTQVDSVGARSCITTDSEDNVHFIYYDDVNDDLKYATDFSSSWITMTLDSSGDVGNYCDIAIDSNDRLHISYYDATSGNLKYLTTAD